MRFGFSKILPLVSFLAAWLLAIGGCSTTEITPEPAPIAQVPDYVQVPHPMGFDLSDLKAIFHHTTTPDPATLRGCEKGYMRLKELTRSEEELKQGARELVKGDPAFYHWCFYDKIYGLEEQLKKDVYVDERQKHAIEAYQFIVPIAKAFLGQFQDSRYLRWAIRHYRQVSEYVFFRRLELSPQMTSELVEVANPLGLSRDISEPDQPVLQKYGVSPRGPATTTPNAASGESVKLGNDKFLATPPNTGVTPTDGKMVPQPVQSMNSPPAAALTAPPPTAPAVAQPKQSSAPTPPANGPSTPQLKKNAASTSLAAPPSAQPNRGSKAASPPPTPNRKPATPGSSVKKQRN